MKRKDSRKKWSDVKGRRVTFRRHCLQTFVRRVLQDAESIFQRYFRKVAHGTTDTYFVAASIGFWLWKGTLQFSFLPLQPILRSSFSIKIHRYCIHMASELNFSSRWFKGILYVCMYIWVSLETVFYKCECKSRWKVNER